MILWTDYLRYRARLRGFALDEIERIIRFSPERYFDRGTGRLVAVGRHVDFLVIIPFEVDDEDITPVTVHRATRQQINSRLRAGRYENV
jgi:hypothetical protein